MPALVLFTWPQFPLSTYEPRSLQAGYMWHCGRGQGLLLVCVHLSEAMWGVGSCKERRQRSFQQRGGLIELRVSFLSPGCKLELPQGTSKNVEAPQPTQTKGIRR